RGGSERRPHALGLTCRLPRVNLLLCCQAARDEELLESREPNLVVARGKILDGMKRLVSVTRGIDAPFAKRASGQPQGENAPLPVGVENRILRVAEDGPEAHHATEVLTAVHAPGLAPTDLGSSARPAPIIESRVTSDARRSSSQPSVQSG